MSTNEPPDNGIEDVGDVLLFAARLERLHGEYEITLNNLEKIFPEMFDPERMALEDKYEELSVFTDMLHSTALRLEAEVSETGAAFGKLAKISRPLSRALSEQVDDRLIEEVQEYEDGDKANLANQIRSFTDHLRTVFLNERDRGGGEMVSLFAKKYL